MEVESYGSFGDFDSVGLRSINWNSGDYRDVCLRNVFYCLFDGKSYCWEELRMAAASCTITLNGETVRVYGGNRFAVRKMGEMYSAMGKEEFMKKHPRFSGCGFFNLKVCTKFNKS